jgi:hypothetical protein
MATKKEIWLKLLKAQTKGKVDKARKLWFKLLKKELDEKKKDNG